MTTTEQRVARLRAATPPALLPALVAAQARLTWARPAARADARAQMRFLLEHTRPDADVDAAARAYVRYQARRGWLRWHPDLITSLPVAGLAHLTAALEQRRGVIVNFVHHGFYEAAWPSIARHGITGHMVVYPYMLEPDAPLWLQQHVRVGLINGGTAVSAAIGSEGLADLLRRGQVLGIASDVPGRTPMRYAGRDVLGSFGAARLALATGAPVVVLTSEEDADGALIRLHEPLQPGDFDAPGPLLERMLAIHEAVQVRWPEAADLPLSRWGVPEPAGEDAAADRGDPGAPR